MVQGNYKWVKWEEKVNKIFVWCLILLLFYVCFIAPQMLSWLINQLLNSLGVCLFFFFFKLGSNLFLSFVLNSSASIELKMTLQLPSILMTNPVPGSHKLNIVTNVISITVLEYKNLQTKNRGRAKKSNFKAKLFRKWSFIYHFQKYTKFQLTTVFSLLWAMIILYYLGGNI